MTWTNEALDTLIDMSATPEAQKLNFRRVEETASRRGLPGIASVTPALVLEVVNWWNKYENGHTFAPFEWEPAPAWAKQAKEDDAR